MLLLERTARFTASPFGDVPDPAEVLDEMILAEPVEAKPVDPEQAELMDALGVSR